MQNLFTCPAAQRVYIVTCTVVLLYLARFLLALGDGAPTSPVVYERPGLTNPGSAVFRLTEKKPSRFPSNGNHPDGLLTLTLPIR